MMPTCFDCRYYRYINRRDYCGTIPMEMNHPKLGRVAKIEVHSVHGCDMFKPKVKRRQKFKFRILTIGDVVYA